MEGSVPRGGSPGIDAGGPTFAPAEDIEGNRRPLGGGFDVGAYEATPETTFRRGEANQDGRVDLSDAAFLLGSLFLGTDAPSCAKAADVNDDGRVDISDPLSLLGFLFLGAPPPPGPFDACGVDPTRDALGCEAFSRCP